MTKFDMSSNNIRAEGGKTLAAGLKGNQVITELNISSNNLGYSSNGMGDTSGVIAIADAIPDMGAMSKLIFGGDMYDAKLNSWDDSNWATPEPTALEVGMTEADFSNKNLAVGGAIIISAWISQKDIRVMTSLNLASNKLGVEGAKIIAACLPKCT
jgi:hypothetical protein